MDAEKTCGQELAASAAVPRKMGELMAHVSLNLDAHAAWVGASSAAARQEQVAMREVAARYRDLAAAAENAARTMERLEDLPPAPHEPSGLDRAAFAAWMRHKVVLQRELAAMLLEHAAASEDALKDF